MKKRGGDRVIGAPNSFLIAFLGLLGGLAVGFFARYGNFCTLGAIEEAYYGTERSRLRAWVLGVAVAIAGTQALDLADIIDLDQSFYHAPELRVVGAILGGMLFGLGMALVGTCAFGMLLRAGGGDMRSLVSILLLGFVGYATANGVLAYIGLYIIRPGDVSISGVTSSALYHLLFGNSKQGQLLVVLVIVSALTWWSLSSKRFLENRKTVATGVILGGVIVYGWWATSWFASATFHDVQFTSYRFARPVGDSLVYLMTFSGAEITFPVGGVFGVLLGSFLASKLDGSFRFEAFDDAREMRRHFGGAALMGMGSIFALGCTIGQGMSGVSTLSVNSIAAIAAIIVSAWLGIRYLVEGEIPSLRDTVARIFQK